MRPVPGLQIEDQPDEVVWRMLVWAEARGETLKGQLAVLWVAHNRAVKSGRTIKQEILKPYQFSAFNKDDPNRSKMMFAYRDSKESWLRADCVCELFSEILTEDPTRGATHYYVLGAVNPSWGRKHPGWKDHVMIGSHVFGVAA